MRLRQACSKWKMVCAFAAGVVYLVTAQPLWAVETVRIPDTGQDKTYNNSRGIAYPQKGRAYYGQDAHYQGSTPAYQDNGDDTVTDLVTGLVWSKAVDKNKVSLKKAEKIARAMRLGGYSDWRVPNIKELYSLVDFRGYTGHDADRRRGRQPNFTRVPSNAVPFINTDYFDFAYGNTAAGDRYIDAQWLSSTRYVSTTMNGNKTLFGVNFADGRIKGYGNGRSRGGRPEKKFYVRFVRGSAYGHNDLMDNGDGTVTDRATGLMWMKADSGKTMNWKQALAYAEKMQHAGYSDWRLPNAKELQYLVDYTRSPDTTRSAAIGSVFESTTMTNEAGRRDYGHYWTSTTHLDGPRPATNAAYIAFGRGIGQMRGRIMDVHGAGCQRSDPKSGRGSVGKGPQGDARRVQNFVRLIRGGDVRPVNKAQAVDKSHYPYVSHVERDFSGVKTGTNRQQFESRQNALRRQQPGVGGGLHLAVRQGQIPASPGGENRAQQHFITRLDRDGDGQVSDTEFDGPRHHFTQFDRNGDGFISVEEAPLGPPPRGFNSRP